MKTRFAPSPTGWMHFGNLRTALFNYLFAHKQNYQFLLRIEDTDQERSSKEFEQGLLEDLRWLSLDWDDGPYFQSQRADIYNKYYQQLIDQKVAYPCFCSEEVLSITRKVQQAAGQPPRYPGTCRNLSAQEIADKFNSGAKATLRFQVPRDKIIEFVDLVKGPQRFAANDIGDFIIRRNDGSASFMFCNAIDDAQMQVTHALRGDDHLTNTPRQIMILNALGLPHPEYGHFAMINGSDGAPLSKRNGSQSVRELRAQGYLPLAVANYLARLGHYYVSNDFMDLGRLAANFALNNISTSPARHDITHLRHWQKEAMLRCDLHQIIELIKPYIADKIAQEKWISFAELTRDNLLMPSDVEIWVNAVLEQELEHSAQTLEVLKSAGKEFFVTARDYIINNPQATFQQLSEELKTVTGAKGKGLFMPLRLALSGQEHGPELAKFMQFIGPQLVQKRFEQVISNI